MPLLGVNIDHIATLRQARYARSYGAHNAEPDLSQAARIIEAAGAHSITIHLREDRRHIQDADVFALRDLLSSKMNLEMGNTEEILKISLRVRPHFVCLVPENRQEITTEGGLDVITHSSSLQRTIARLQDNGTRVSLFIDPEIPQIEKAAAIGADMIELHTGAYANEPQDLRSAELARLLAAGSAAHALNLQVNAGHGITLGNLPPLLQIPGIAEFNIGHSLISHALTVGLAQSVKDFLHGISGDAPSK